MIRLLCGGRLFRLAAGRFIPVGRSPLRLLLSFFLFLRLLRLAGGKNFLADLGSRFRCFKIFHRRCGIHRLCISLRLTFGRKRCVVFLLHGASSFPAYFHKLVLYQRLAGLSSLLPFWGRYPMLPVYHGRAGISCCFCKRNVTVGRKVPGGGVLVVPGGVGWQRKPPAGRAVRRTARRRLRRLLRLRRSVLRAFHALPTGPAKGKRAARRRRRRAAQRNFPLAEMLFYRARVAISSVRFA